MTHIGADPVEPVPQRALRHFRGDVHRAVHARGGGRVPQLPLLRHPHLLLCLLRPSAARYEKSIWYVTCWY